MICKTVAFAGGPSCGKSSVHSLLKNYPVNPNYNIIFLDEVATEFLNDMPHSVSEKNTPTVLQYYILRTQLMLEKLAKNEAKKCERNNIFLLDRGVADLYVYCDDKEIANIITPEQEKELDMRYDCIMFFEATGILSENNPARIEKTLEDLNEISLRTKKAWSEHSEKMFSIPPAKTIEEKAKYTAMLINRFVDDEVFIIPDTVIE